MIVELHNQLGNPQCIEATRVVLRSKKLGPLAVAFDAGEDHYHVIDLADGPEAMMRALRILGVNDTVITDNLKDLPKPPGKLWTPDNA